MKKHKTQKDNIDNHEILEINVRRMKITKILEMKLRIIKIMKKIEIFKKISKLLKII